jgi:DNA-binding transcriptional regulator YdaS (Cro superfamily)
MKPTEAILWAGSQTELARRLGVTESAVSQWVAAGRIPELRAYQIQVISAGAVVVDPCAYRPGDKAA